MKQRKSLVFLKSIHNSEYYIRTSFHGNPTKEFNSVYSCNFILVDYIYTLSASKYLDEIKLLLSENRSKNKLYSVSDELILDLIEKYKNKFEL